MTVLKSTIVTTADDLDDQIEKGLNGSGEKVILGHVVTPTVVADNDVILMCEVPVEAKISSIKMSADDLGTTGDLNVGFYPGPGSGITIATDADAVDEDAIGTAIDVNAAVLADVEIRFETANISTVTQKAWELAGLSAKPDYATFYLAFTASEATTAAGDLVLIVRITE